MLNDLKKVETNLAPFPDKLRKILEEHFNLVERKASSESADLSEGLSALQQQVDSIITSKNEEIKKRKDCVEQLCEKNKSLLENLIFFVKKVGDLEDLSKEQNKKIENLEIKLALKKEKRKCENFGTAAAVKMEPPELKKGDESLVILGSEKDVKGEE